MNADLRIAGRILANDARLLFRMSREKRANLGLGYLGYPVLFLLLHLPAWGVFAARPPTAPGGAEFVCLIVIAFLLMTGLLRSIEILHDRGDLPMLLATPVPTGVVLATRLCNITFAMAVGTAPIAIPVIDMAVLLVDTRWAHAYLAWLLVVVTAAPFCVLAMLTAVAWFGAPRARTIVQLTGLALGLATGVLMQLPMWLGKRTAETGYAIWQACEVAPLSFLARLARGDLTGLAVVAGVALVMQVATWKLLAARFASGAQDAASHADPVVATASAASRARVWRDAFRDSPRRALVRKETRILLRNPFLLANCASQILSLVPALIGVMVAKRALGFASVAVAGTSYAVVTLATLTTYVDEAHELVATSPVPRKAIQASKALAAALPMLGLAACLVGVLLLTGEAVTALLSAGAALVLIPGVAWWATCSARPATAEQRARGQRPRLVWPGLLALLLGTVAVGGIGGATTGHVLVGAILYGAALLGGVLLFLRGAPPVDEPYSQ